MPRQPRLAIPGEIHHVMSRGMDGMDIFRDDADRERFVSLLAKQIPRCGCRCYAWVLMPSHYHLLLRPQALGLKTFMRRVNTSYARYYNSRYQRRGYVFQDRYKSLAAQDTRFLQELIRFIHLNPVRAGLVQDLSGLEVYAWSGHRALLGLVSADWQAVGEALQAFGSRKANARSAYLQYLDDGLSEQARGWDFGELSSAGAKSTRDGRIAGDAEFVRRATTGDGDRRANTQQRKAERKSLQDMFSEICDAEGVGLLHPMSRGRLDARSAVRRRFCRAAVREHGYSVKDVAVFLSVNPSSVSRMAGPAP